MFGEVRAPESFLRTESYMNIRSAHSANFRIKLNNSISDLKAKEDLSIFVR